ncbi:MAG: hypothetical protein SOX74_06405 [Candidatus Faecousia sp.]|uniref:hypothetical protein n=1 Tax=Faecousia sp. TaxID=2952921 RepID=UPI002A8970D3|nr:hypothetical protein [Candidatus Faecousia sp.]
MEPLNQSAAALSGSFAPAYRFENLEIHKVFLQFPNLNLEQNPSLTALAIESELPYICSHSITSFQTSQVKVASFSLQQKVFPADAAICRIGDTIFI